MDRFYKPEAFKINNKNNIPKIVNPSITKNLLKDFSLRPKKSLGQNFLIDNNILDKIITAAQIDQKDIIIEIGPGLGALTQKLAENAGQVIAIELDNNLVPILNIFFNEHYKNVHIISGDALKLDWEVLTNQMPNYGTLNKEFAVVANLPYYITSPLIMYCLEHNWPWKKMILMVQKELAERIKAQPGTKDYGRLSVAVQYYADVKIETIVPPSAFKPQPKVSSAVISLSRLNKPRVAVKNPKLFFQIVAAAFSQRRKTLLNALTNFDFSATINQSDSIISILDKNFWRQILAKANIDAKRRGETLSLEEFAILANTMQEAMA